METKTNEKINEKIKRKRENLDKIFQKIKKGNLSQWYCLVPLYEIKL